MAPFVVNMAQLYEHCGRVAHRAQAGRMARQEAGIAVLWLTRAAQFSARYHLEDAATGARCWCDTKYKVNASPEDADIAQMVAYGVMTGCRETALIYPSLPENAETYSLQGIRVHSVSFAVDGDLEEAGRRFLAAVGEMA